MTHRRLQAYFFLGIFALSLALLFFIYRPFLDLIVFAGVLTLLMWPVHQWLLKYFKGFHSLASFSTVMLTLILLLIPLTFFVGSLAIEAVDVFNRVRTQVRFDDIEGTLAKVLNPAQAHLIAEQAGRLVTDVAKYVQPFFSGLTASVFAVFSNTVAILFGLFLVLVTMYYLFKDGAALKEELMNLSPLSDDDDAAIFARIRDAVKAVAYGGFTVAMAKGVIGGVLFFFLGLPAPVFWGTMIALSNFVPGIGTAAVTATFAIYLFATGHFWKGLLLSAVSMLVIGLVDNFLTPQLIRRRINIHPLLILFSILGGLSFFGAFGVFFGPIILSVTLALIGIYKKEFRDYLDKG